MGTGAQLVGDDQLAVQTDGHVKVPQGKHEVAASQMDAATIDISPRIVGFQRDGASW